MADIEIKHRARPSSWLFLSLSVSCQAMAVILGKTAALRMGKPTPGAFLTNPWYLAGLGCLVIQAFFWQLVLRDVRLFVAYLATSFNYFVILAVSSIFFREPVSSLNIIGAAVIVAGVYLVVREDLA